MRKWDNTYNFGNIKLWFQAEKRENLELQTPKMKTVKRFENFGEKFNDEELFGSFDAL